MLALYQGLMLALGPIVHPFVTGAQRGALHLVRSTPVKLSKVPSLEPSEAVHASRSVLVASVPRPMQLPR